MIFKKTEYLTSLAAAAVAFVGGCPDENSAVPANSAEKTVPAEAGVPAGIFPLPFPQ